MRSLVSGLILILAAACPVAASPVTWEYKPMLPGPAAGLAAVDVGGTLFIFGGTAKSDFTGALSKAVFAYTRTSGTWTAKANMPVGLMAHAAAAVGTTVYVMGGHVSLDGVGGALGSTTYCYAYNVKSNTWSTIAAMSVPREASSAAVVGGKIYIFGGFNTIGGAGMTSVESYDPATNLWSSKAPLSQVRFSHAAAAAPNGLIYVIGGIYSSAASNIVEAYNVAGNSWSTVAAMPTVRSTLSAVLVGPLIYALGGENAGVYNTVEAYDWAANTWRPAPPLLSARAWGAAVFHQGTLYMLGGHAPYPTGVDTVEEGWPGLAAAGSAVPAALSTSQNFEIRLTATNAGWSSISAVTPFFEVTSGGASITPVSGPIPAGPLTLGAPGMAQEFVWTFNAASAGTVKFTMTVIGTESGTGNKSVERALVQVAIAAPPAQPVFITAQASNARVNLSWLPATPGTFPVSGYKLFRATTSPGTIGQIGTTSGATTVFADTTVTNGNVYFYRVEAFDSSVPPVSGQISAEISATPWAPPGVPLALTLRPQSGKIVVNWLPGTPGTFPAGDFHLFRRTGPGTDFELVTPGPSATYYSDNGLVNGTTYTYYMYATDSYGHQSATTSEVSDAARSGPFAPGGLSALGLNQRVILNWSGGSAGTFGPLSGYTVYRGAAPGAETYLAGPVYGSTYTDGLVFNGTNYFYVVRSRDAQGHESANSAEVQATPVISAVNPPTGVVALAASTDTGVSWIAATPGDAAVVGNVAEYAVLRATCAACGFTSSVYVNGGLTAYQDLSPPAGTVYFYTVRTRTTNNYESGDIAGVNISAPVLAVMKLSASVTPAVPAVPNAFTVSVTVTHTGGSPWSSVSPQLWIPAGGTFVAASSGPTPGPGGPLGPPPLQTYTWDLTAKAVGPVTFTVSISARDDGSGDQIFGLVTWTVTVSAATVPPPPPTVAQTLDQRVESGKTLLGPNVLDRAAGSPVRIALRGNAGGHVRVRCFDEAGREVRVLTVDLDGQGRALVPFNGADAGGRPLAPGVYYLVSEGGGVQDRRLLVIRGKRK